MSETIFLIKAAAVLAGCLGVWLVTRKKLGRKRQALLCLVVIWLGFFCSTLTTLLPDQTETVTLTALGTKNELAEFNQVILSGYTDGEDVIDFLRGEPREGIWREEDKDAAAGSVMLIWLPEGDAKRVPNMTEKISLQIPVGTERSLVFDTNIYGGEVLVDYQGKSTKVDTYAPEFSQFSFDLPESTEQALFQNELAKIPYYLAYFVTLIALFLAALVVALRKDNFLKIKKYKFLFEELVKRDFTLKYKRTILGMLWSILSPLFNLLIMWLVFNNLLGAGMDHYVIYLFAGQMLFSYFSDATMQGMTSLLDNAMIFTKINVPKYMFLLSKNVSSLINFGLTLVLFFIFVSMDGIAFHLNYLMLLYPIACLILFNLGLGMVLSALYMFFRDMQYLWGIMTQLIMWLSAIFYAVDTFTLEVQNLFFINPLYQIINYFRQIVIYGTIPSFGLHVLMLACSLAFLLLGCFFYKKYNHEFLYYV